MTAQLHVFKGKLGADGMTFLSGEEEKLKRIEKEQMVDLLKRNHDVLLEKHELVRRRNEVLERTNAEKEGLHADLVIDHDKAQGALHKSQSDLLEARSALKLTEKKLQQVLEHSKALET